MADFLGNTSNNTLGPEMHTTAVTAITDLGLSSDGALLYAASPGNNDLYVLTTSPSTPSTPMLDQTLASASASAVADPGNPVLIGTLNGTTSVTGLASTAGLSEGESVSGNGIPAGTTIAAINSASAITLSLSATASGSSTLTFVRVDPVLYTNLMGTLNATTAVGLSSTAGLYVGEAVSGSGIPLGTTIAAIDSAISSITLSQAATTSGPSSLTFLSDFRPLTGTLNATTTVTGLPSTSGLYEGEAILGAGIPAGDDHRRDQFGHVDHPEPGRDDQRLDQPRLRQQCHVPGRDDQRHEHGDRTVQHGRVVTTASWSRGRHPRRHDHHQDRLIHVGHLEPGRDGQRIDAPAPPQDLRPQ